MEENKLLSIVRPLSQLEATIDVNSRMVVYPHFIRVIRMKFPFQKTRDGMELRERCSFGAAMTIAKKEDDAERSIRRTRKAIKDYVFCNNFDAFASFTFSREKVDRFDVSSVKKKMSNWLKNEQKRKGKFQYLIVCEFHKKCEECVENRVKVCNHPDRPKAMHFHALLKGYRGEIAQAVDPKTGEILKDQFTLPSFTSGYTNLEKIDESRSQTSIAYYLQKYLSKDVAKIFGKNRYWVSPNLKKPIVVDNPDPINEACVADRKFENDFALIEEYDEGKSPLIDDILKVFR